MGNKMPKKLSKEELEKLSLRERLDKLKELEEADKKELQDTKELIKKTERELISVEASTDTGPGPEPDSIADIAEEAPAPKEEKEVKEEAAKYESYTPDYTAADKPSEEEPKVEDGGYKPVTEDSDKSTATRTTDKDIKKYSKG